jgi:aspartate racemase
MQDYPMKTIGILGGMGPEATLEFFKTLLSYDPAERDQDHLHIIVECDPAIPDRTAHILGKGRIRTCHVGFGGASACRGGRYRRNTLHDGASLSSRVKENSKLHFVSALEAMEQALRDTYTKVNSLGILATAGTKAAKLYESALPRYAILWPNEEEQKSLVMEAIYGKEGIKAGNRGEIPKALLKRAARSLIDGGAQAIVAGCTKSPSRFYSVISMSPCSIQCTCSPPPWYAKRGKANPPDRYPGLPVVSPAGSSRSSRTRF